MAKQQIMTVASFKQLFDQFKNEITEDFQVFKCGCLRMKKEMSFYPCSKTPNCV